MISFECDCVWLHQSFVRLRFANRTYRASQFFANLYLDDMDHHIRWQLCTNKFSPTRYLRYVDDLILLSDNKEWLWHCADNIQQQLNHIKLQLHPKKVNLLRTTGKVDMFGYQISRSRRWLRNDNGYRFRRRYKQMAKQFSQGKLNHEDIQPRIASLIGHAQHGETWGLRKSIFRNVVFKRQPGFDSLVKSTTTGGKAPCPP